MANLSYKITEGRPINKLKVWEKKLVITDLDTGQEYTHTLLFEGLTPPKEAELDAVVQHRLRGISMAIDNPPQPEETVETLYAALVEKGYLTEGQTIDDLPNKEELLKG